MADRKQTATLDEHDLDQIVGGGVMETPVGGWGKGVVDPGIADPRKVARARYIGETEKTVWKAPAGTRSD